LDFFLGVRRKGVREVTTLLAARTNGLPRRLGEGGRKKSEDKTMLKKILIALTLSLLVFLGNYAVQSAAGRNRSGELNQKTGDASTGTLQKMIVENGSVTMDLDLNRLNGINLPTQMEGRAPASPLVDAASANIRSASRSSALQTLHFAVGANSFFSTVVFNNLLRGPLPGSMALVPQESVAGIGDAGVNAPGYSRLLGASLQQLAVEKLPSGQGTDLAVRDSNTGFTFFDIQGHQYDYDPAAQSLAITNGKLVVSKQFAQTLGRPSDTGAVVGTISIGAVMQPIEVTQLANGKAQSVTMPPIQHALNPGTPTLVPGPDVIVGDLEDVDQQGSGGTQVGLAIGTDSCNNGQEPIDWFALPQTDHPVVPQNLYRMSGGAANNERFEQIGQSWMKHTFLALQDTVCGTCNQSPPCNPGPQLCPGCSDPYVSGLNGDQDQIGSRAWVNPFTGSFPPNANDHSGHVHAPTNTLAHRILVETSDLIPGGNPGATYYGEAAYISPHEFSWCQSHPGQCNMFNNFSYRQFSVTGGPTNFSFPPVGGTVRMQPAIQVWAGTGATVNQVEPDPGNDGIWFMGYEVTNPSAGVWHYEYALFNMNLDRSIQSFSVPLGPGVNISNIGFHAPPQQPGQPHDGTQADAGFSSTPWDVTQDTSSITWSTETFATNQNANAIRWGTLYNFRFDADQPPQTANATVGYFKTGSPITVEIQAPGQGGGGTPTPTPTPTATPTATVRPTPTPRPNPIPRQRPTPHPRP
jgi:hypothetical protein